MHRLLIALLIGALIPTHSTFAVTIDTVLVGNAGNPSDPIDGDIFAPGIQHFGSVAYDYRIGKTEVTNAHYVEFLNAKAKSDPLNLFSTEMSNNIRGGIARSGVSGSFTYAPKPNMADKPVNFVTWFDSIRFVNWLNNGQGNGDTEVGTYKLGALDADGVPLDTAGGNITRSAGAKWFLPSQNEWYKAAYYQPAAQGGDVDNYWLYPTRSNTAPTKAADNSVGDISNPGANVVNYGRGADWNNQNGNITTVGSAGPLSASFYGTFDQGGNVGEFTDTVYEGYFRMDCGGDWASGVEYVQSQYPLRADPRNEFMQVGFRVAGIPSVPEPSTLALAALGALGLLVVAGRRRFMVS